MHNVRTHTQKFHTDEKADMEEYDKILNDPLCAIMAERKEKLNETQFDENTGKPSSSVDEVVLVVTWEEKYLP